MKYLLTVLLFVSSSVFATKEETIEVACYQNYFEAGRTVAKIDETVSITKGTTTLASVCCFLVDMRSKQPIDYEKKLPLNGEIFNLIKESVYRLMRNN
jgi:hypothetical protein